MRLRSIIPLFCIASVLYACDDNDKKANNSASTSQGLTFECQNSTQIAHFSDSSTVSISCDNYGGCDADSSQCVNLPKLDSGQECSGNDTYCSGSIRYACDGAAWIAIQACDLGCSDNTRECKMPAATGCINNTKKCENNKAFVCNDGNWGEGTDCGELGCSDITKECRTNAAPGCTDGDKKCENNKAFVCNDGIWSDGTECGTLGCNDATRECRTDDEPECSDGDKKCVNNKAYVCTGGSWGYGLDCGEPGCNEATNECRTFVVLECTSGDKKCEDNKAYVCADGSWGEGSDCGTLGCNAAKTACNKGVAPECNDGDKKCEDNKAYVCADGSWDEGSDCGILGCNDFQTACKIAVVTPDCTGTEKKCESNKAYVCADGSWGTGTDCGTLGCNDSTKECNTEVPPECTGTEKKCESNKAYVCADGSWGTGTDCGEFGCNASTKECNTEVPPECTGTEKKCESNKAYVCADGSWGTGTDCGEFGCNASTKECNTEVPPVPDGDICVFGKVYKYSETEHRYDAGTDCPDGCDSRGKSCRIVAHSDGDKMCIGERAYTYAGGSWGSGTSCANGCDGDECRTNMSCTDASDNYCEDGYSYTCSGGSLTKNACSGYKYCVDNSRCDYNNENEADLTDWLELLADDSECTTFGETIGGCVNRDYRDGTRDNVEWYVTKTCLPPFASQPGEFKSDKLYWQVTAAHECESGQCSVGCAEWDLDAKDDCTCTPENVGLLKAYCENYKVSVWVDGDAPGSGHDVEYDRHNVFSRRCICRDSDCRWFAERTTWEEDKCPAEYVDGFNCSNKNTPSDTAWCSYIYVDDEGIFEPKEYYSSKTRSYCYEFVDGGESYAVRMNYKCNCVDDDSYTEFSCTPQYVDSTTVSGSCD